MAQDAGWGGGAYGGAAYGGGPYGPPGWGGWVPPPKPGVIPLAPLKLGDVLGGAFSTMGRYWKQLFGLAAALYGGAALLMAGAVAVAYSAVSGHLDHVISLDYDESASSTDIVPLVVAGGVLALLGIVTMAVVSGLMYAAVPAVLQEAVLGRPAAFAAVWRKAWAHVAPVIGALILTALVATVPVLLVMAAFIGVIISVLTMDSGGAAATAVTLGILGALVTGPLAAWIWIKVCLAPAAVVFEGRGPVAALRRSAELVRGDWWRIFGITLLAALIAGAAGYVIQIPFSVLGLFPGMIGTASLEEDPSPTAVIVAMSGYMVATLLGQLVSQIISTTFPQLVTGLLYVDRRIRTENLGPALAEAAGVPAQGGPMPPPYGGGAPQW
ncbi:hypothetical protein PV394_02455 [Streptomyces sp. NE06-03E]|uniref:DUF7847 domain-containing protein n=1 Tax=Streptomyces silvae TaxID=2803812 RepID=A0ABU7ZYE4_9ACTN|nr:MULTISPECIES: hypothetical protein [unclassified Streptomyces]WSS61173.1 hypothetical protein OG284_08100 [Streptomyces sp. NBC_01177]WSS68221.1 hypothetical protein OG491_07930 [Streptomyces sp. NBC_01175]MDX3054011.1 hypothetical protein [Streptomyces sp. NE06-03E]MDX3325969.1 hypothetical protein [Streptomyces sp. ME02-6979-3A]MDX3432580.1 hypothetical protein [Streptomyces sp. ME01-18a]